MIGRVYPPGWSLGEKLTSAQMNAVDTQLTWAADKRTGQVDSIGAVWTATGAGRLIGTYAAGADANTNYLVTAANGTIDVGTLTADRTYTLQNTGAVAGDRIQVLNRSTHYVTVQNASAVTLIVLGSIIGNAKDGESFWAELLYNGTAWELYRSSKPTSIEQALFNSSSTYRVPRSVTQLAWVMCGSGGGGAGGQACAGNGRNSSGGGGGGGAIERFGQITVIPGETINVGIGAVGGGGTLATNGGDGGDAVLVRASDSSVLAISIGAAGGSAGPPIPTGGGSFDTSLATVAFNGVSSVNFYSSAAGGSPVRGGPGAAYNTSLDLAALMTTVPQNGARGRSGNAFHVLLVEKGNPSPQGFAGGSTGGTGSTASGYTGGGGGGGGGAGPYGVGGAGGNGGNGNNAGAGGTGSGGIAAGANSGAGGGGGGASGASNTTSGSGGPGGNGGTGRCILIPAR